ncbi:hypothetical protein ERO13_D12G044300v2 [Gossypium hirsutum]|uniref:Probable serine/threonine-protein kinase At1g09600 isoform X1 n=1 Tax=Gossypium hirsutum TaxID=3635 RepID=A0A1U8N9V9_GOSHI|nr:probable serine/threonine-protein kinase At1g09600 isoform X1 [Gossypium hirsutum]KAG4114402.1 hypothetical protein ERO13_D12G044300v2 [Gossypium hirsutum]
MGCICWKGNRSTKYFENNRHKKGKAHKDSTKTAKRFPVFSKKDNAVSQAASSSDDDEKKTVLSVVERPKKTPSHSQSLSMEAGDRSGHNQMRISRIIDVTGGEKGAQVVAGWPSWLAAVAGEAINGWIPRTAESFEKLEKIGQGTYSSVYKARDLESNKIVALKKVRFANMDPESVRFMSREIILLRRLDHPNVMKLEGLISSRVSGSLYLIFEYMEHDLAGLVATPGIKFTEAQIKCYMQQLLRGLDHCHSRGVLHRDIKGANLLIDYNGNLKIGDFGLATLFRPNQKQTLTSRVVTLWYRPPELLLGSTDYGVSVDLWSSGCILAELFAGKPIMPGRTEVEQMHKIFKLCGSPSEEYWKRSKLPHATIFKPQHPYKRCVSETFKDFPTNVLALLEVLLAIEPECRGTASSALESEFFTTNPLPCGPSNLPKYPPSKEFDVKLRDDESRRQRAVGGKLRRHGSVRKVSRAVPVPELNAELRASIKKRQGHFNAKSVSGVSYPQKDGSAGFLIEPPKGTARAVYSRSGQSLPPANFGSSPSMKANEIESVKASAQAFGSSRNTEEPRAQTANAHCGAAELSRFSNSVAASGSSRFDMTKENTINPHCPEECLGNRCNHLDNSGSSKEWEWSHQLRGRPKVSLVMDELLSSKESSVAYVPPNNRIHYSGPLMPPGENLDEMLKEHERQIQDAVRKARLDKTEGGEQSAN